MDRVNELLREVVADQVERLSDEDDRIGMLTISAVECSPDLRQAVVLFASLSPEAAEALDEHRAALQRAMANQVHLKRTPKLSFAADPTVAAAQRVDDILRRLATQEGSAQPSEDGEA